MSYERVLIDNFLNDCEEAGLSVALFGEFDEKDGRLVQTSPGIFTFEQFITFMKVGKGTLPPEALDDFMPGSGKENAITPEQIEKARAAGVTDGIGMALIELVGLRQRAKEAFVAAQKPQSQTETQPQ
jgi:hypothetical protein